MEPYSISVGLPSKYTIPFSHLDRSIIPRNGEYYPQASYPLDSADSQVREPYDSDWLLRKQKPPLGVYGTSPRYIQWEAHREIYGRERERVSIGERHDLAANDIQGYPSGDSLARTPAFQQLHIGNANGPRGDPHMRELGECTLKSQRQSKEGSYMDHPTDTYPHDAHGNLLSCSWKNGSTDMLRESFSSTKGTSAAFMCPSVGPFRDEYSFMREAPFTVSREALIDLPRGATIGDKHPFVREAPSFVSREALITTAEDEDTFMRKVPLVACRDAPINLPQPATIRDEHPFVREGSFAVGRKALGSLPRPASLGDEHPCVREASFLVGREASINLSQAATIGNEHPFMRGAPSFVGREASINLPWADITGQGQPFMREGPSVVRREASINLLQAAAARDELQFMTEAPFVVSKDASVHLQRAATFGGEHSFMREAPFVAGRQASINLPQAATSSPCKFHFSSPSAAQFSGQEPGLHESVNTKLKRKYMDTWGIRDDKHNLSVNGSDYHSRPQEMENNNNPWREQRMGSYTYDTCLEGKASRHTFNKVSASGLQIEDESAYMHGWPSERQVSWIRSSSRPKWNGCNLQYDYDSVQKIEFEQGDYHHYHKLQKHNDVSNDLRRATQNDANHGRKRPSDERPVKDDALPIHSESSQQPDIPEDSEEFKKHVQTAYLRFAKLLNENQGQKRRYLEQEKRGSLRCIVCGRFSKDFVDTHDLVLHAYNSKKFGRQAEHMGLHKALCVLMGWNHATPPDDTRSYQSLASLEAMSNKEDLILWPPLVIVHNACIGKGKDGRWEGIGNPEMDELLKDIGFGSGKSKALYGRDGHQGIILIKFLPTLAGLQEAERLQKYFEGHHRGRKDWLRVESLHSSQQINDDDTDLVRIDEETKEKKRVLYGYIGISGDLDKVDFDTRKRVLVKSRKDIEL